MIRQQLEELKLHINYADFADRYLEAEEVIKELEWIKIDIDLIINNLKDANKDLLQDTWD